MKILLGVHSFFPLHSAGTEVLTLELARALRTRGHNVTILACARHENIEAKTTPWLTEEEYDSFPVHYLNYGVLHIRDSVASHVDAPDRTALLCQMVMRMSPDVVHFKHIQGFSSAAIAEVKKLGVPVYFTATDYWTVCPRTNLLRVFDEHVCQGPKHPDDCLRCAKPTIPAWAARASTKLVRPSMGWVPTLAKLQSLKTRARRMVKNISAADGIFVSTRFLASLLETYGVERHLLKVIPYGVHLGDMPERVSVPTCFTAIQPLRIVFIGSLVRLKGAHVLLEALTHLTPSQRSCLDVQMYGKTLDESPAYGNLLEQLADPFKEIVQFRGTFPHEEIGSVLRNAQLCVVPSIWYESAPLVLCSALAAGTPVLVSDMGGMTEIVQDGDNGFVFSAGNSKALAEVIVKSLNNPALLREMAGGSGGDYRTPEDYAHDIEAEYLNSHDSNRHIVAHSRLTQ